MIANLTNHLWQSTLFAILIGLLTLGFRSNRAHIRYWMWLTASLKFLLPCSLLISLGAHLHPPPAALATSAASFITLSLVPVTNPLLPSSPLPVPVAHAYNWPVISLFTVWVSGLLVIAFIRLRGLNRIRAAIRQSTPINVSASIQVRSSPVLLEPGVVGSLRPILLLPLGITQRLAPPQMKAVLSHELCHVRRRDNLTSAAHIVVEAIFWFHPLVWWIGARLLEERERACDESVLGLGHDPRDYAEAILNICKSYLESPVPCVSGVTGSNLKKRVQLILAGSPAQDLTLPKRIALAVATLGAIAAPIVVGAIAAPRIQAQSQLPAPKFQLIAVRPCNAFRKVTIQDWSPGTLHSECTTVQRLIQQAYGLFADGRMNPASSLTVTGGSDWTTSSLYEIEAKADRTEPHTVMNGPVLQAILEETFKLKFHRETRDSLVYAVTSAAGGPKLQAFSGTCTSRDFNNPPSPSDCGTARLGANGFEMDGSTISDLCAGLSALLDRRVVDQTAATGRFNIQIDLSASDRDLLTRPRALPAMSDPTSPLPPPIPFQAVNAAMQKLGLNLGPASAPGDFLVIDQVERP